MLGVYVTVPIACFRKGFAREFRETEQLPPPATCYGFLLSLVGECDRQRHIGCRVAPTLIRSEPQVSVVLRTMWRIKNRGTTESPIYQGQNPSAHHPKKVRDKGGNTTPDFQQLLTGLELAIWVDSSEEIAGDRTLEERVTTALESPASISRFGGLSLGESTHLVNDVCRIDDGFRSRSGDSTTSQAFLTAERGRLTLPVWVDHVGSAGTRYATGDLVESPAFTPPDIHRMPKIGPDSSPL